MESSILKVEESQLLQPVLIEEVLQPSDHLSGPAPTAPCPYCVGGPRTGHSTPGGVSSDLCPDDVAVM